MLAIGLGIGIPFDLRQLVGNVFTGAAAAYSLRIPFLSAYSGPLIRVRRSSDNAQQDINAVAIADVNGNRFIDTTALLAFTGAGNGFLTTWYDQSVNANHATQATDGRQPRIVNAGVVDTFNGNPAVLFTRASTQSLRHAAPIGLPTGSASRSVNAVYRFNTINVSGVLGYGVANNGLECVLYTFGGSDPYASGYNEDANSGFAQDTVLKVSTITFSAGVWSTFRNGTAGVTNAATLNTTLGRGFSIGSGSNGTQDYFDGYMQECVVTRLGLSDSSRQYLERNQGTAYGITVA